MTQVKELFRSHEHILKPKRPFITDSLYIANRIPIAVASAKQPVAVTETLFDNDDEFYDAPDHFSDSDSDDDQAPDDDITNMVIKFHELPVWNNSEDNKVEYILPPNFSEF